MVLTKTAFKQRLLPILLAQGFGVACGIAGVKVTSAWVNPSDLGLFGVWLTFTTTGMWIVHAGLVKYVARHWDSATNRRALLAEVMWAWARKLPWLAAIAVAAGFAIDRPLAALGIFAASSLLSLVAMAQNALQAVRENWRDCGVAMGASLSRTFLPPLVYFLAGGWWAGLWLGFVGHALVAAAAGAWALQRYWSGPPAAAPRDRQLTAVYTGPLFITLAVAGWVLNGANRWLVAANFGAVEAGYFTLAGNAAIIVPTVLSATFLQFFRPSLFAQADQQGLAPKVYARSWDHVVAGFGVLALLGLLLLDYIAPWLVGPLINPTYADALEWIFPVGCFGIATNTALFYHTLLLAGHREKACAPLDLSFIAVMIAGCTGSALLGRMWFQQWLLLTPVIAWMLARPLTRHYLFMPDANQTSAVDR
ncbi:MAG: hypothetical protein K9M98_09175 [Cephaloticoccus sp.]|nr:hypothetical protein [Cephaloticoccus sp.]MCF7760663.1 hypothetical protein [Cephaloticoccus sp.]